MDVALALKLIVFGGAETTLAPEKAKITGTKKSAKICGICEKKMAHRSHGKTQIKDSKASGNLRDTKISL